MIYTGYSVFVPLFVRIFCIFQVELNMVDLKKRVDSKGRIMKSDFIEYSLETKLLDLTDCSRSGGKGKDAEEKMKKSENIKVLKFLVRATEGTSL